MVAGQAANAAALIACAVLLTPFVWFGFGLADRIGGRVRAQRYLVRIALPLILLIPFPWPANLGMAAITLATCVLASAGYDWAALAVLGITVDLGFFKNAFAGPGMSSLPKLMLVDTGLYCYLVLRPLEGVGYDFRLRLRDFGIGLREFAFFTPIAIALGFALSFLHFHAVSSNPLWFSGAWLFTIFFIAIPEELFFRGLLLNILARRIGTRRAVVVTSVLFGLAHFNKRAAYFNWRYVILACVAGVFYARAWLANRRVLTSAVTHATVDSVWSIWLR